MIHEEALPVYQVYVPLTLYHISHVTDLVVYAKSSFVVVVVVLLLLLFLLSSSFSFFSSLLLLAQISLPHTGVGALD